MPSDPVVRAVYPVLWKGVGDWPSASVLRMSDLSQSASIIIAAEPATIFNILANPSRHPDIDGSGSVRQAMQGPDRLELGSEFGMSMKLGLPYRIKNRVVEFEEDRLIAWRHYGQHRWRYELTPTDDGGTQVTETWDLSRYKPFVQRVFNRLFGSGVAKSLPQSLANLKELAEQA